MTKREVHANINQLKGAYKALSKLAATEESNGHYLLRFYANECGLKALFLRDNQLSSTRDFESKLPGKRYGHGHDLLRWTDELKIPISYLDNENDPLINAHEKLRYGLEIQADQKGVLKELITLLKQGGL